MVKKVSWQEALGENKSLRSKARPLLLQNPKVQSQGFETLRFLGVRVLKPQGPTSQIDHGLAFGEKGFLARGFR